MSIVADHIRGQLPEIGEGLSGQMADLSRDCTPERCERALINLRGAQQTILRLREALQREAGADAT
ncbi:hypothetical protein E2F46_10970 [Luteimonas aestuarii]|uniref:Uncharacterized protein n=1 Tax=Luteimonas aestuarii TaxID=453837 RepID=A0A4R5TNA5_9GAMM|nr:hypothetical protein [Luteimonas aestuarii]TDK23433.1 hypothetical protein E2F46_10970 [Luteimonas aestuarii]